MSKKLLGLLGLVLISGCTLYFGPDDDNDDGARPPGGDGGGDGGWACGNNYDCAAGCWCDTDSGTCVENGFCTTDADCSGDLVCDDRNSCVPPNTQPPPPPPLTCTSDAECAAGCYCDEETQTCVESGYCTNDSECPAGQECDETRSTCIPVPPPACEDLNPTTSADCTAAGCDAVFNGQNCTDMNTGLPCDDPSSTCTCETYTLAGCATPAP
jgi:hypothetical protein